MSPICDKASYRVDALSPANYSSTPIPSNIKNKMCIKYFISLIQKIKPYFAFSDGKQSILNKTINNIYLQLPDWSFLLCQAGLILLQLLSFCCQFDHLFLRRSVMWSYFDDNLVLYYCQTGLI